MRKIDLSLILPCYNEAEHFEKSAETILRMLKKNKISFEIIFVEDNSTDATRKLVESFIRKHPKEHIAMIAHKKNLGRGQTVIDGIYEAKGLIAGFIDIDLEIGAGYIKPCLETIKQGYDVVYAAREYTFSIRSIPRWIASRLYQKLVKIILGVPIEDTEAGYKFFRRKTILPILKKTKNKRWFWDTEIMVLSLQQGLRLKGIPVTFVRRFDKTSTVRLFSDTVEYIKDLYHFKQALKNYERNN